ncbi:hypothetical protein DSL92_06140 [Billgrantia gudaonensis]|uniref:Uncharacterized protein n=1 Tax=Billgrantia gudaonensis TaxID=376427 RepID=A0A3S0NEQ0_9GAMM|nr:hypothetical protein DSL92_06140 [Halomonas gudaonensis]
MLYENASRWIITSCASWPVFADDVAAYAVMSNHTTTWWCGWIRRDAAGAAIGAARRTCWLRCWSTS